jgi:hypothetical protein
LPTTDALFAQEVEQKMSNLLAGFLAPSQLFPERPNSRQIIVNRTIILFE